MKRFVFLLTMAVVIFPALPAAADPVELQIPCRIKVDLTVGSRYWFRYNLYDKDGSNPHTHNFDLPSISSSSGGSHSHSVNPPPGSSQTADTGDVMPYIQLRVCRKN